MGNTRMFSALLIGACAVSFAPSARADAIDGDWCSPDGSRVFTILGPRIVTGTGVEAMGDYSRHAFSYVVPGGESGAGMQIDMVLMGETQVRVTEGAAAPEVWLRCKPVA